MKGKYSEILIDTGGQNGHQPISMNKNLIALEEYQKIITAWTTYKLATEN